MNDHKGMRPQDIVVLLKITTMKGEPWLAVDLARALQLSSAEVSNSLKRSAWAGLIDGTKRRVTIGPLLEFLKHGLPYAFPVRPAGKVRGIPTAHSAPPLGSRFSSEEILVWPSAKGNAFGQGILPLYPGAVDAALADPALYELLALTDALRVGRSRERSEAAKELMEQLRS